MKSLNHTNTQEKGYAMTSLYTEKSVIGRLLTIFLLYVLSVDDTAIAKWGRHFDGVGILYDHAKRDSKSYLNGNAIISLTMSVPILHENALYRSADWLRHEQRRSLEADACLPASR